MLLFLLTAREGRLSANPPRLSVIAQFQTRHAPRTRPAPSHSCASHSPPTAFPATKPATSRVLYSGTNSGTLRAQFKDFEAEFWGKDGIERKPILCKYKHALTLLNARRLDEGAPPYKDACDLIGLRNALVHYKPMWDPERKRQTDLAKVLKDRFPLSPFPEAGADFVTMKCMSVGCASWAISTVVALVEEFDARTNLDAKKIAAFCKQGI